MYWMTKYKLFFVAFVIISANTFSVSAQEKFRYTGGNVSNVKNSANYKSSAINNSSKFSLAFLPTYVFLGEEYKPTYSNGYGFNIKTSYELSDFIKISGSIEAIFTHFKMTGMDDRNVYETTSNWYSIEIGPKFLSPGKYRVFWNFNLIATQIYHGTGSLNTQKINNPDNAVGFNMGIGAEIPINKFLTLEVNPLFNILHPVDEGHTLASLNTYFKISFGLINNL
jgi:hypothetical protein